jgi:hypothetical protein
MFKREMPETIARTSGLATTAGCAALLAAALLGGCMNKPNDAQLVTNIQSQMFADQQLKGASVQVTSAGGEVTLKGNVPNEAARYEAYKLVTQTAGVKKVNDMMTVDAQVAQAAPVPPPVAPPPAPAPAPAPAEEKSSKAAKKAEAKKLEARKAAEKKHHENEQMAMNSAPPAPPAAAVQTADSQTAVPPPPPPPDAAVAPAPPPPPPPPPPPQPQQVQIPSSSTITIRMIDGVDSSVNKAGEVFHASLDAPIVVGNDVIVPKGADIYVRLANASSAGKLSGQSELRLELVKLEFQGQSYPLVSTTYQLSGSSRGKDTAKKVGGGAILGAIIGGIAGGGKGAAIGATVGGGAGGAYQVATHGQQVKVPSETKLDFQLDQPVTVTVQPKTNS